MPRDDQRFQEERGSRHTEYNQIEEQTAHEFVYWFKEEGRRSHRTGITVFSRCESWGLQDKREEKEEEEKIQMRVVAIYPLAQRHCRFAGR